MKAFIVLLRGVNVGGHNVARMASLRHALTDFGFRQVATYVQSGNIVLVSDESAAEVASLVDRVFADTFGFSSRPTVRDLAAWRVLVAENPFAAEAKDERSVSAAILDGTPPDGALESLRALASNERLELRPGVLYLHAPDGFGRSKVAAALDRQLKVPVTVRNWRTVTKLLEMVENLQPASQRS